MLPTCQAMLSLARELANSGSSEKNELKFRVAVNRAYYSVFLFGRMKAHLEHESQDVHKKVLDELYRLLQRNKDLSIHGQIKKLLLHRKQADYIFPADIEDCLDWKRCAENAVSQAGYALEHLEKL